MIGFISFLILFVKFFDTFAGIGGFALPLTELGHECIGFSEIDRYATAIYRSHFPSHHPYGDITKLEPATLPDFDLLVGGFPCQAFSIAGKRRGFDDTRGTLFFDLARILQSKKPRFFIFENVKGLLSHDGGRTFATIIATLAELGYDVQWQVLNSKHFGVPQNRERVFVVGHLRSEPRPEVFPLAGSGGPDVIEITAGVPQSVRVYSTEGVAPTLFGNSSGGGKTLKIIDMKAHGSKTRRGAVKEGYTGALDHDCAQAVIVESNIDGKTRVRDVAPTLRSPKTISNMPVAIAIRGRENGATIEARSDDVSNALRTGGGGQSKAMITDGMQIRRLTPTECERLQAFPDRWTEFGIDENGKQMRISDTQRYKTLGNAVSTCVVREIAKHLPN